jgi:hypothetical protein
MSNYTKDKNIIIISIDGMSGNYKFDLATGLFYGVKGNPIKTNPKKRATAEIFYPYRPSNNSQLAYTLYHMFDCYQQTSYYPSLVNALGVAEKLDNMKLVNRQLSNVRLEHIAENFKDFVDYLKTRTEEEKAEGNYTYNEFVDYLRIAKAKKRWGEATLNQFPEDVLNNLIGYDGVMSYTAEEMQVCAYHLVRGKMHEYHRGSIQSLIEYISMCRGMKKEPQKVNNFMREYCETKKEYELRKTEFDNARIADNYRRHTKAFEFEHGDFIVVLPTCGQDLIDEGRNMHHCVGGYVNKIVEGSDYIVFIRRKDNPEQCYLTCEVDTEGHIRQYYLAYDRNIRNAEDIEFKTAFQNHLLTNWAE